MFGVYKISENTTEPKCDCGMKINEGQIILFKDRIEKIASFIAHAENQNLNLIIDTLRYIVLMHELGHWFTHWCMNFDIQKKANVNWECGYYINAHASAPDKITHESLAQLICFWTTSDSNLSRKILIQYFTPSEEKNEYNKYLPLIDKSKNQILSNLKIIRNLCKLMDSEKYKILKSNFTNVNLFFANEIYLQIKHNNRILGREYGLAVNLNDIEETPNILLEYIYFELIQETKKKSSNTQMNFQKVYKKLNKTEDKEIFELWKDNKKFFGEEANDKDFKIASTIDFFGI